MRATSRQNALASHLLTALVADREPMYPCTPEVYILRLNLCPETTQALLRALRSPTEARKWAEAVNRDWAWQVKQCNA